MLCALRSLRILFSLPAILFVLGTSCTGKKHHELPGDSPDNVLLAAAAKGDAETVGDILQKVKVNKIVLYFSDITIALSISVQKGHGGVVQVILQEGEKYLKAKDLWRVFGIAGEDIKEIIRPYIENKEKAKNAKKAAADIEKEEVFIKQFLEEEIKNVDTIVQKIREVRNSLGSRVSSKHREAQEEFKKDRKNQSRIEAVRKLDRMASSLSTIDVLLRRLEGGAGPESIEKIREIGKRLQEVKKDFKPYDD
ncbi:MAG: hypothetical protein MI674_01960 [Cytophagales bacterium]|nr:hypothetical protein [Cytophagales bacterium]